MGRATLMLALGGLLTRLIVSGGFGAFVQQRMKIPLILAAAMLIVLGLVEATAAFRQEGQDPDRSRRSISPTVGWLLGTPLLVLIAVAPTPNTRTRL